jgi:hypothetical protein
MRPSICRMWPERADAVGDGAAGRGEMMREQGGERKGETRDREGGRLRESSGNTGATAH